MLLYGSKGRVMTGLILNVLEGFHHRAAKWISGITDQRAEEGEWQ